jgi:bifunctional non-homologous end joining protein LigD
MKDTPAIYMVFDVLYLDGRSTMGLPYTDRRELLQGLGLEDVAWKTPAWHEGEGSALLDAAVEQGLEGIVAKRLDSRYTPSSRGGAWLKIKRQRSQELVIGGWVPGEGRRRNRLGALLVGHYRDSELVYAGKVGTGFTEGTLSMLGERLAALERATSPFDTGRPPRDAVFVEPELVAEVEFTEWTRAGTIRHPSFKGLRDDKPARDVVREEPSPG